MNGNENDSSKKMKQNQGTLDWFVKKTNREDASSSSSPIVSSSHSKNDPNKETEMGELNDTDDLQSCENEGPFARRFHSQCDQLFALIGCCSVKKHRHPLVAPLLCVRFLLAQGVEIYGPGVIGPDNKGDLAELLEMLSPFDENVDEAVIKNAPLIERDLINACAKETTKSIVKDVGDDYFAILVGKYFDNNNDDVIALCLRYVDKVGDVVERFLGIMNVVDASTALSYKNAVYALLEKHSLSSCNIRGQGYIGVSNMKGDFSGLQTLIKKETQSAYYTHCFANRLELTLAGISEHSNRKIASFFFHLEDLLNVVLVSWKENGLLTESHFQKVNQAFDDFTTETRTCLNQKARVGRSNDDTCWGPYYKLLSNVIDFYPVILEMVDEVANESPFSPLHQDRIGWSPLLSSCRGPLATIENFDFVFSAHLMKTVFEVTNELSSVLQKKDENIVTAMSLVKPVKERLQVIRDDGWETLLTSVVSFCNKNDIEVPNMEDVRKVILRKNRQQPKTTNLHHYQVEVFFATIDLLLQELNSRFDEVVMELLVCMGSLSPIDSFSSFDKQKLIRLAEFYPNEFSSIDLRHLNNQLDNYIDDVRKDERFMGLKDIKELSKKLVEVKKHQVYNLVYLLIKLALILPIATASVERASSAMTYVKKELKNSVSDELLNDRLVAYVEGEVHFKISNDDIIKNFESSKIRQEQGQV
ncbi:hypothetical protein HanPI659440_Chr03g0126961 [Helianthus annuus]|nr:hypothetical protein HanPI659440_Chr03g0126961 [Helianthus annuus]